VVAGDRAFFAVFDQPQTSLSLWVTDGTVPGTVPLAVDLPLLAGTGFHSPALDSIFFPVFDLDAGEASIWSSDGTPEGTAPLPGFEELPVDIGFPRFVETAGAVFFSFYDPRSAPLGSLWRADRSGAGGALQIAPVRDDLPSAVAGFAPTPDGLRFFVNAGDRAQLWRSDGTAAGTGPLVELPPGTFSAAYGGIAGGVAFLYTTAAQGPQVWVSDDTVAGTRPATAIPPPPPGRSSFTPRPGADALFVFVEDQTTRVANRVLALTSVAAAPVELPLCAEGGASCRILSSVWELGGRTFLQADDGLTGLELWQTDATPAGTFRVADLCPGACSSGLFPIAAVGRTLLLAADFGQPDFAFYALEGSGTPEPIADLPPYRASGELGVAVAGSSLVFRAFAPEQGADLLALDVEAAECVAGDTTLCLGGTRFALEVSWRDFEGRTGVGRAQPLTADTGTFWFFDPANLELIVKVLDARAVNGYYWVFYGALSNVEYDLTVTDTETGASRTYHNPAGTFASNGDTEALPGGEASSWRALRLDAAALAGSQAGLSTLGDVRSRATRATAASATSSSPAATAPCAPDATTLCLGDGRFALTVEWTDFTGGTGAGQTRPLTADTGSFWFFHPDNVELVIKVLDARGVNGRFWVFYGALSNVAYTITVTDTGTGTSKTYRNELGAFGSVGDTDAF
jgi:ELWxxDGT repeat protein